MKLQLLSCMGLCALVLGFGPVTRSTAMTPTPQPSASTPLLFEAGGYALYQPSSNSTDADDDGPCSNDPSDWDLTGFVLAHESGDQVSLLHVLAIKKDPTGLDRWAPYGAPGDSDQPGFGSVIRYEHLSSGEGVDEIWAELLEVTGIDSSEVNKHTFVALASDPTVGTLP